MRKKRLRATITGVVQGVGFRPFVYKLAESLGLKGFVLNNELGVVVEVEGEKEKLTLFLKKLSKEKPPAAKIYSITTQFLEPLGYKKFEIRKSKKGGKAQVSVLPDLATCKECLKELFDEKDRRYLYPFINCTNCGPRFTIILSLPYDRKNTTMKNFKMCPECLREFNDPLNRRFHAQPNACPKCGPQVWLINEEKEIVARSEEALKLLAKWIKEGKIVAVKGLGGFHLVCDATNQKVLKELRRRKRREEKPFAVMFKDLNQVKEYAFLSPLEEVALTSPEAPIVILRRRELPKELSPDTETVGAFLPYTPLHHILLKEVGRPVVATSCNITDEPIMKDNKEVESVVGELVDGALLHDREIARRCDDSVVRVIGEKIVPLRRSRGYAPLPVLLPFKLKREVLALGAHMKNTISIGKKNKVFISQHVVDVDNYKAEEFLKETVKDLLKLFEAEPEVVVCDYHPGYFTTKLAKELFKERLVQTYHHHAHAVSLMAENGLPLEERIIALTFDGTGYGKDGTVWGGEFLNSSYTEFKREISLYPFKLPGGEKAVKEPFRTAASLLVECGIEPEGVLKVGERELSLIKLSLKREINAPTTSSMGRLFDGVSAILGLKYRASYQAQGAIVLEEAARKSRTKKSFKAVVKEGKVDWREMVLELLELKRKGSPTEELAKMFHNWVVKVSLLAAKEIREKRGIAKVGLTGGVFQNKLLTETLSERLKEEGFKVLTHQVVPPNDGGISLGQAVYGGLIEKGS
ncbi:carbamoyltransferase HypF [Thermovibrio sp.]